MKPGPLCCSDSPELNNGTAGPSTELKWTVIVNFEYLMSCSVMLECRGSFSLNDNNAWFNFSCKSYVLMKMRA